VALRLLPPALLHRLIRLGLQLPEPLLLALARSHGRVLGGRTLDARFHAFSKLATLGADDAPLTLEAMRGDPPIGLGILDGRPRASVAVERLTIELPGRSLRTRLYRPANLTEPSPLLVFFHFGGCVIGTLATCHTACTILAEEASVAVLSVEYRLAPEHRYPAAVDDAVAWFRWAREHAAELRIDPDRIAVGGDSAGGYLAGAVAFHEREQGRPMPTAQLLIYPVTNWNKATRADTPFDRSYPLDRGMMDWFCDQYLARPEQALEPLCSLDWIADLAGLPPALVALAGHDLLCPEGDAYAARLAAAGVPVERYLFDTLPHAFSVMTGAMPDAARAMNLIGQRLGAILRGV
jgi:acetyl esterase